MFCLFDDIYSSHIISQIIIVSVLIIPALSACVSEFLPLHPNQYWTMILQNFTSKKEAAGKKTYQLNLHLTKHSKDFQIIQILRDPTIQ